MKVLFAVSNENISETIVKKYQKDYKEIISYKNVYYFNAIIKEMQKDKSYDRIVISEDLEPFANNNYDTIDKFLFEKLDNISDEANDKSDRDTQIILICTDRRTKTDGLLIKLFGIGIYSAIIGKDRSIEEVCKLIDTPRTKKEAKLYYKIESEDVSYQAENDTDVNENEIQSILRHYKSLGKDEDRYIESFNNISSQYTDAQLRIIIKFLPINVKAVLEEKSPKYQEIVTFGDKQYKKKNTSDYANYTSKNNANKKLDNVKKDELKIDAIENRVSNPLTGKPIIIPSNVKKEKSLEFEKQIQESYNPKTLPGLEEFEDVVETATEVQEEPVKKGRGRPKKVVENVENIEEKVSRGRGRPRKIENDDFENVSNKKEEPVNLFEMYEEPEEEPINKREQEVNNIVLPGLENESFEESYKKEEYVPQYREQPKQETYSSQYSEQPKQETYNSQYSEQPKQEIENTNYEYSNNTSSENLLTKDQKIVSFVGTSKNGTSFIVNNLALLLSSMGINTAILDATKNKNSYYIYTKNEEDLRKIGTDSILKLKSGMAEGIEVNKNLTVYTALPGEEYYKENINEIMNTLENNHSLVLIDCDFDTPIEYFDKSQEIYLVQTMDVLTIQPLTAFLRDLKNKGILKQEKLRIILNKSLKIRGLSEKVLIGGIAYYNDPAMSYMTELFNKDLVKFVDIPFELPTYVNYLGTLVTCEVSLAGYSRMFMTKLKELGDLVYPLLNKKSPGAKKVNNYNPPRSAFSDNMNNTLNQMKNKY